MNHERYIAQCIDIGILTTASIRKYPLRSGNIAVVLKAYALNAKLPFEIDNNNLDVYESYRLFLTEKGLAWLINEFKKYTPAFLRTGFNYAFSIASQADIDNIDNYVGLNNFKGLIGINYKQGTQNKALLVRQYGKNNKLRVETMFDTLVDARKEVLHLTRYYPAEQFTLYRLSKEKKNGVYYKKKVPLFLTENRRGSTMNLPHLKGKL